MIHAGLLQRLQRHRARGRSLLGSRMAQRAAGSHGRGVPSAPRWVTATLGADQPQPMLPTQGDAMTMPTAWAAPASQAPQPIAMAEDALSTPDTARVQAPARAAVPPAAQSRTSTSAPAPAQARVARALSGTPPSSAARVEPALVPPPPAASPARYRPPTPAEMRDALLSLRNPAPASTPVVVPEPQPAPSAEPRALPERVPMGRRVTHVPGFNPGASAAPPMVDAPHTPAIERPAERTPDAAIISPPVLPTTVDQPTTPAVGDQSRSIVAQPVATMPPADAAATAAVEPTNQAQPRASAPASEVARTNPPAQDLPAVVGQVPPSEPHARAAPAESEETASVEDARAYLEPAIQPSESPEPSSATKDTRPTINRGAQAIPATDAPTVGSAEAPRHMAVAAVDQQPATAVPAGVAIEPPAGAAVDVPSRAKAPDQRAEVADVLPADVPLSPERGDAATPIASAISAPTSPVALTARPSIDERLPAPTPEVSIANPSAQSAALPAPQPDRQPPESSSTAGSAVTSPPSARLPAASGAGMPTEQTADPVNMPAEPPDIDPQDIELLDLPPMPTPLRETTRSLLHDIVGIDPAEVVFEQSAAADTIVGALHADAVTDGEQVLLAGGRTDDTPTGLGVIAHELVHVARRREPRFVPAALRAAPSERVLSDEEALAREVERRVIGSTQQSAAQPGTEPIAPVPDRTPWGELPAPWEPWSTQPSSTAPAASATATAAPRSRMVPAVSRAQPQAAAAAPSVAPLPPPRVAPTFRPAANPLPASQAQPARPMPLPTTTSDAPAIQRAELGRTVAAPNAAAQPAAPSAGRSSGLDVDALARQVYTILKRRLAAEMRRSDNT